LVRRYLAAAVLVSCGSSGSILSLAPVEGGDTVSNDTDSNASGTDASIGEGEVDSSATFPEGEAEAAPPPLAIVLVDPTAQAHADDPLLEARLALLGFDVQELMYTSPVVPSDGAAVVVVSSSATAAGLASTLPAQPIPIVVLEGFSYATFGMTGDVQDQDYGVADETSLDIVDTTLSGLPLGTVVVYTEAETSNFAQPSAGALVAARIPCTNQAGTFGYPAGTMMVTQVAPARRVGLFLRTGVMHEATPEGWVMFDTMVRWAVQ
jgi:hypothetical protein